MMLKLKATTVVGAHAALSLAFTPAPPVGPAPVVGPNPVGPNPVGPNPVGPNPVGPNPVGPNPGPNPTGPTSNDVAPTHVNGKIAPFTISTRNATSPTLSNDDTAAFERFQSARLARRQVVRAQVGPGVQVGLGFQEGPPQVGPAKPVDPPLNTLSPEDPVNVIGMSEDDIEYLKMFGIFTVRQFAAADILQLYQYHDNLARYLEIFQKAQTVLAAHTAAIQAPKEIMPTIWGYHYVSESVYQQIEEEKVLKSAFVLFGEFLNCPTEHRDLHPWMRVYHAYQRDAAAWVGPKKKDDYHSVTSVEVYSFLVWRSAQTFAEYDVTAGPRAIYFNWQPMPTQLREDCIEVDKIIGEDQRNHLLVDRYSRMIRINLTALVEHCSGKIFRVKPESPNKWKPTTLPKARKLQQRFDLWNNFTPGESYFNKVPHGCIVTPPGEIMEEFFEFDN